jgi:GNAT superfamily N-acetyltransferase
MITIRPYRPETDEAFVYDSWLKSRRDFVERDFENIEAHVSREEWRGAMRSLIGRLIAARPVVVAEAEGVILGWRCPGRYAYVKSAYRGKGIFKRLRDGVPEQGGADDKET